MLWRIIASTGTGSWALKRNACCHLANALTRISKAFVSTSSEGLAGPTSLPESPVFAGGLRTMSLVTPSCSSYAHRRPEPVHFKQAKHPSPNNRDLQSWRPCRRLRTGIARAKAGESHDLPSKQPEELSATTVDGGKTLTEVAAPGGSGTLAVPLSGVVLPEGLDPQEQRKRLWFAAIKPPMYTVALIPILVNFS